MNLFFTSFYLWSCFYSVAEPIKIFLWSVFKAVSIFYFPPLLFFATKFRINSNQSAVAFLASASSCHWTFAFEQMSFISLRSCHCFIFQFVWFVESMVINWWRHLMSLNAFKCWNCERKRIIDRVRCFDVSFYEWSFYLSINRFFVNIYWMQTDSSWYLNVMRVIFWRLQNNIREKLFKEWFHE